MKSDSQDSIPIHVWIKSLVLAAVFFWAGFAYFSLIMDDEKRDADYSLTEKIFTNIGSGDHETDIYFLGSSLARCAFFRFASLESSLSENSSDFKYKGIIRRRVILDEYSGKIEQITNIKPKYLFLEANMVCMNMFKGKNEITFTFQSLFQRYISRLALAPRYISSHIWRMFDLLYLPVPPRNNTVDTDYWSNYARQAKRFRTRSLHDFPEWDAFFEYARDNGIQVYLFELPRSREGMDLLPDGLYEDYLQLIKQYRDEYGIEYLAYPEILPQKGYFKDAAHLNRRGADLYSNWLVETITRKIMEGNN